MTPEELQATLDMVNKELETIHGLRAGLEELRLKLEDIAKKVPTL